MAKLIDKIPVIVDGESAYDFRLKINQTITGVNTAFENVNDMYKECLDSVSACEEAVKQVGEAEKEIQTYIDNVAKPEINNYFEEFLENVVGDIDTTQVRRNTPVPDSTGYLPKFFYKVIDGSGPLVLYAKLSSPSIKLSNLTLTKNSDWSMSSNSWTINGSAKYNSSTIPDADDIIRLMLKVEDGSYIKTMENVGITSLQGVSYTGIAPKYDVDSKTIFWTCGPKESWSAIGGSISVSNITITDGVVEQKFNINISLSTM